MAEARGLKLFYADFESALTELPLAQLRSRGVKVLAFDLDHTLGVGRTRRVSQEYLSYLASLRQSGFRLLLASNAMEDLSALGEIMGATVVPATWWSRKPAKSYFRRLVKVAGCEASEVAMIGDRVFTDVLGANRFGLVSVKVTALGRKYWGRSAKRSQANKGQGADNV